MTDAEFDNSQQEVAEAAAALPGAGVEVSTGDPVVEVPDNLLALAIAAHFEVDPQAVTGFACVVEYQNDNGLNLSSAWSAATPVWRLRAFARELLVHLGGS